MTSELDVTLRGEMRNDRLAEVARELVADVRRIKDLNARLGTRTVAADERADVAPVFGQIIITFLSAGAATALIGCLKAYIDRDRHLKFSLRKPDGTELVLESRHLEPDSIDDTVRAVGRLLTK